MSKNQGPEGEVIAIFWRLWNRVLKVTEPSRIKVSRGIGEVPNGRKRPLGVFSALCVALL